MSIEQVWNEYKQQRDGDFFTDNVSVVFVPTAAGARGYEDARKFLSAAYDTRVLNVKENVLHQTIGQNSIVEESETTVKFVAGEGAWLVPGVDSRYTEDNHVVFPTVNVCERQVDAVKDASNAVLNPFGRVEPAAARMNPNQISGGRRNVHTSSRVNQPGGTGGKSTIFDHEPDDHVTNRRFNSNKNQSQFSIGDDQAQPNRDPIQHSQKKINPNSNASQIQIGDDGGDVENVGISRYGKRRGQNQYEPTTGITDDGSAAPRNNIRTSSRQVLD
ncbi:20_t:CDS:2 [Racocetra fulgida]|uniref:20_t:CDS:1 n=1 Tax=Racocetra fulgida TaxID=60492 RepID=A0A9N9I644_9GLOM|nr:20_t:CDS:2 [Racocetra fulgida]